MSRAEFMATYAPAYEVFPTQPYVVAALVGKELVWKKGGLLLAYRESFVSPELGLCHSGTVLAVAPWRHIRVGMPWAWKADELEEVRG